MDINKVKYVLIHFTLKTYNIYTNIETTLNYNNSQLQKKII